MKKNLLLTALVILIAISANSQTASVGRTTAGYTIYSGAGRVILNSGDTIKGNVSYVLNAPGFVKVTPEGEKKEKDFLCNKVKEFYLGDKHYYTIKASGSIGDDNQFSTMLLPEDYKIQIYKFEQQSPEQGTGFEIITEYYVKVPGDASARPLSDVAFMPFHKKVSKIVESCQALSQKIINKEEGYKLGMMETNDSKVTVFKKVAEEFQNCK